MEDGIMTQWEEEEIPAATDLVGRCLVVRGECKRDEMMYPSVFVKVTFDQ